ncbi:MAG: NAD(P)-dependent oxidoreductase [Deltaproteobacteria bacterium]|jgi:3-hydroxyisobutyrate dehydrogenase-like beta-hydroxyacid dehydrogenase|nr:NAD(P)-dependent oxidoreductase [Deltaproteobacteria bacterium]
MSDKISFIGLGNMGSAMARRILAEGHGLTVYNRTPEKAKPLAAMGAKVAGDLDEAVSGAGVIFTMLSDDAALLAVMGEGRLGKAAPGSIHVSMGTVGLGTVGRLASIHESLGQTLLSSPVFGRPEAARLGKLNLCLAGPAVAKERVSGLLAPMGKVWDFGPEPAKSNAVKLAGNFMIASLIELLAEAFSLVEGHGVAPGDFFGLMAGTLFNAPAVHTYGKLILEGKFDEVGFLGSLGSKDVGLVKAAARLGQTPLPFCSVLEDRFLRLMARGWGDRDWSAISALQREDAGLR